MWMQILCIAQSTERSNRQRCARSGSLTIRRRTYAAVRWTAISAVFRAGLQVLQTAVLARMLDPADYGLMAIVSVVLGFANLFSDFGLSSAFVQRREVTEEQRSALFWFNLVLGCAVAGVLCAIAPLISRLYADDRFTNLIALSAITIPIGSVAAQVRASAEKALEFRKIGCIEICAATVGAIGAIALAEYGFGVRALVCGAIISAAVSGSLNWRYNAGGWRPAPTFGVKEISGFARFGGAVVANNVVNYVNASIDVLIGGRMLDSRALGSFSVPRDLSLRIHGVINPVITRVGFPLIALVQADRRTVTEIYRRTVSMSAAINAPIYIGLSVFGSEVIDIWLGEKWATSAPLLQVLALWGGVRSTANPAGSLLMGLGRPGLALMWNLSLMFLTPCAVGIGLHWGAMGMAIAMLALQVMLFAPGWALLVKPLCDLKFGVYIGASGLPFVLSIVAWVVARLAVGRGLSEVWRTAIGTVIAVGVYVALTVIANRDVYRAARDMILGRDR